MYQHKFTDIIQSCSLIACVKRADKTMPDELELRAKGATQGKDKYCQRATQ